MEDEKALKGNKTISTEPKDTLTNTKDTEKETKDTNTKESTETKETNTDTKDTNTKVENDTKEIKKETKNTDKNTDKKNNNSTKKGYGNNGNLISFNDRTTSEQREIARMGGIASGIARRQKKALNEYGKMWLDMKPTTKEMELLESQGVADERDEMTRGAVLTLVLYREAVKGNMRAIEKFFQIEKEVTIEEESKTTDIIGALNITAKDVWSDNSGDSESIETKDTKETEETKDLKGGGDNAT